MRLLLVAVLGLGCVCVAEAQVAAQPVEDVSLRVVPAAPLRFDRYTVNDGLPQGTVNDILQDRRGFLWFATIDGLSRFDGHAFTTYQPLPFDTTTLASNYVSSLMEDAEGTLWAGTTNRGGLHRVDPLSGACTRFRHDPADPHSLSQDDVTAVFEGADGTRWIGTRGGLNRMGAGARTFTRFLHDPGDPSSLSSDVVTAFLEDRSGRLWVATTNGLNRFDEATSTFTRYFRGPEGGPFGPFYQMAEDPQEDGVVWAGTDRGLVRLEAATGRARRYVPEGRPVVPVLTPLPDPAEPGILWATTFGDGLYRIDTRRGTVSRYAHDPNDPTSLVGDRLLSLHVDRTGVVWVGAWGQGLSRFTPGHGAFTHYRHIPSDPNSLSDDVVYGLYEDRDGILWIGTENGLNRLDPDLGTVTRYFHDPADLRTLSTNRIRGMLEDRDGNLWVGTSRGGLHRMDRAAGTFTRFRHDPDDSTSLGGDIVSVMTQDQRGTVWVGTWGGLNRMDAPNGRFTRFRHDPDDSTSLNDDRVSAVFEDREGTLWVGTWTGLNRMDREAGTFERFLHDPADPHSLSSPVVSVLYEDSRGRLWVGTGGGGLNRMDRGAGTFTHYTTRDGLPNNSVWGILEDEGGRLWLSTNQGLSHFDPETGTFRNYTHTDGLPAVEFNIYAALRSRRGLLFFGGMHGVTAFDPARLHRNPVPPEVVLTGLRLFNEPVRVGADGPLARPLPGTDAIRLTHRQNTIGFDFVGLHFQNPEQNQYTYRLEGFDPGWSPAGTQRTATYTNLPPGTYTFRVRAANSDGVWNEAGASVLLTIAPPWWRTAWAYAGYALLFLGAVAGLERIHRRRLLQREREKTQARELAQARELEKAYHDLERIHRDLKTTQAQLIQQEKMASLGQLTAGIAHEIKNPLNFVTNFAVLLGEQVEELETLLARCTATPDAETEAALQEVLSDLRMNALKVNEHGRRADGIVRSMLLHSRGRSGQREPTDLNLLAEEYLSLAYHGVRAQNPGFICNLDRHYGEDVGEATLVPQDIGRVLLNLLANAFYAVHQRALKEPAGYTPTVRIRTRRRGDEVEVAITDNGPGIPRDVRERIFEPFFTTKPSGEGSGLGLSLSYDIVTQGHGGTLTVESAVGHGTTFTIRLPVGPLPVGP